MEIYRHPRNRMVAGFVGAPPMNFLPATLARREGKVLSRAGSLEVDLTERWPSDLPLPTGATTLAVRPENVSLATTAESWDANTKVFAIEPLGAKTVIDLMLDDTLLRVLVRGRAPVSVGESKGIVVDARHVHVIDEESGKVVL